MAKQKGPIVVVPAAGMGRRMGSELPKCMLSIGTSTIIERALAIFANCGIDEVVVIVGYKKNELVTYVESLSVRPRLHVVVNDRFMDTNTVFSLYQSREYWDRPVCLVDADVIFAEDLFRRLIDSPTSAIVVDSTKPVSEIDVYTEVLDGKVVMLSKDERELNSSGEFCPLSIWTGPERISFIRHIVDLAAEGRGDQWYEMAINRTAEAGHIQTIAARENEWFEVDTPDDLKRARRFAEQV